MSSFYSELELRDLGFKSFGKNILISKNAKIYGSSNIEIGDNVRIDDFCILSGKIKLGSHIHISAGAYFFAGEGGIVMEDFTNISSRCVLYAVNDDYSGLALTGSTVPVEYRGITQKKITIKKHSIIGSGSTILPGVSVEEGTAVGCMSLLINDTMPWMIYVGVPAKPISKRSKQLIKSELKYLENFIVDA